MAEFTELPAGCIPDMLDILRKQLSTNFKRANASCRNRMTYVQYSTVLTPSTVHGSKCFYGLFSDITWSECLEP